MRSSFPDRRDEAPSSRRTALVLAGLVLVAAALRFYQLDTHPWGLHADQVGIARDGLNLVRGRLATAPSYNTWLHAAEIAVFGATPLAVRVLPALAGSLLPLSVFLAVRALFGPRPGLMAAALAALSIWPLTLSRLGFSIIYLPVVLGLLIWQLAAGWQTGRARSWLAAGLLLAAAQYIYYPARLVLPVLGLAALYALLTGPRARLWRAWPLVLAATLAMVPLFWHTRQVVAEVVRYNTVSILAPENNGGQPVAALVHQFWLALSMFFYQGDANYRHNVPPHPVYNPLVLAAALIGLWRLLREWRRPRTLFWLTWIGVLLVPMLLSIESPHFLRSVGVLPLVFVPPAVGLAEVARWAEARGRGWLGLAAILVVLGFTLVHTGAAYFGPAYRGHSFLYYAYDGEDAELAVDINRFLGAGWQGSGWRAPNQTPLPGRTVWLDPVLWTDLERRELLRVLVPVALGETPAFGFIGGASASNGAPPDARLVVVPGHEQQAVEYLPRNRLIRVQDGPLPSWQPPGVQPVYRLYTTESPAALPAHAAACFADGIELLTGQAAYEGDQVRLNLDWRAVARNSFDYTVFVHLVAQEEVASQVDSYPVAARFPTSWWRPGDVIADDYALPVPPGTDLRDAYLRIGLYRWDTVTNLPVSDCAGHALGEFVRWPVPPPPQP
jgi:4-amino-4-deoxy-L-arabinose transferase-like glycosyltransferase